MADEQLVPIADVNINLPEVSERLFLGPQGALIERIEAFNTNYAYGQDAIRITKNFSFKPGTYDRVKDAHGKYVLRYTQAPRSMWHLCDRISRYNYLNRMFWEEAQSIQQQMSSLKNGHACWQDNTQVVEDFWQIWIERLNNEMAEAREMFPNTEVNIYIDNNVLNNMDRWKEMNVIIEILTKDIQLDVIYQDHTICEYDWGHVATRWTVPIWKFLNNWCEGGPQRDNVMGYRNPSGKIYPKYIGLSHPYISRHNRRWDSSIDPNPGWINGTCTGAHQSDLGNAVWKMDIMPLVVLTRTWLSKYHIPNTNPLNRIYNCIYGMPEVASVELWKHRSDMTPERAMSDCEWPYRYRRILNSATDNLGRVTCETEFDNPCNTCQFRDGYTWQSERSDNVDLIKVRPCNYAIIEYVGPQTDEEAIKEACIIHMMVCEHMRLQEALMNEAGFTDLRLSEANRFPVDAELSNIYEVLGEEFHLEYHYQEILQNHCNQDYESLLDNIFGTRIFFELIEELVHTVYGENFNDDDAVDMQEEWEGSTLQEIRNEIDRVQNRDAVRITNEYAQVEESLTTEERTIRWATSRGSAINI